jgi:hypothetical protein
MARSLLDQIEQDALDSIVSISDALRKCIALGGKIQCPATARFGNGQITVQGLLPVDEPETFVIPVTGGSGADLGAEGAVHVRQVSEGRQILTFRLEG